MVSRLIHIGAWRCMLAWFVLVWLATLPACAQTGNELYSYRFTTGVDSNMWESHTQHVDSWLGYLEPQFDYFDFYFGEGLVSSLSLSQHGVIYINNSFSTQYSTDTPFDSVGFLSRAPFLAPVGSRSDMNLTACRSWLKSEENGRVYVIELELLVGDGDTVSYRLVQVHIRESDNSVTFVYGELWDPFSIYMQLGMAMSPTEYIVVDQLHHTAATVDTNALQGRGWPGRWRYYRFEPTCLPPREIQLEALTTTSVRASWLGDGRYWVEYDTAGFTLGEGIGQVVDGNEVVIQNLMSDVTYDVYVRRYCGDSLFGPWKMVQYSPFCEVANGSIDRVRCWELERTDVRRGHGTFRWPDIYTGGTVGHGFDTVIYHFSIHDDPEETDVRTLGQLHTVCPGHCRSVRLGNWQIGAEQESIEYRLEVDTSDYDLLILHYAIVEENPNHPSEDQPYFTIGIYDTLGSLISDCYYANFIAGDMSGWNYIGQNWIVWRDWSAVGVDLTSLHGETVLVRISNADCNFGGHYGYGYYNLESAHKRLRLAACGEAEENTLYAPKGFSYRWYRADNPSVTLSTADSLHATVDGYYCCTATYQLSGQSCSFTVSAYVGNRYPVAAFSMERLDSCGRRVRFVNESFVAHDSAHTLTSTEPCERYRWLVDGVAVSESGSPVYEFDEGDHTVTLYAILGEGQCVDSVSHTASLRFQYDSIADTICRGLGFDFYDTTYYESGVYEHHSDIRGCDTVTRLHLHVLPIIESQLSDTFQLGTTYHLGLEDYTLPGVYQLLLSTSEGCDSICNLHLSSLERHDTTVCVDGLPFSWRGGYFVQGNLDTLYLRCVAGTDSIVVLGVSVRQHPVVQLTAEPYCEDGGYYLVPLSDTLVYRWEAQPVDLQLPAGLILGSHYPNGLRLEPTESTVYSVITDYPDAPKCPQSDTLLLEPVPIVNSLLHVSPSWLWGDNPELTATDLGDTSWWREWYINGVLQSEEGTRLVYRADVGDDSLQVMLINYSELCSDTAYATVTVSRQELWFPNVITPDEATNNVFRGYGVNIVQYDLQIYTKWGNRIFHTKNMEEVWDGTYNGVRSPESAYVYKCTYKTHDGEPKTVVGIVTLLR